MLACGGAFFGGERSMVNVFKRSPVISSSVLSLLRGSPINKAAIKVGPDTVIASPRQK